MFCVFGAVLYFRNITLALLKLCFFLHRNYIFPAHFALTTAAYEVSGQNLQANNHDSIID